MGDLHAGHLSLIRRSVRENDLTAVSIFVNPKQFETKADYEKYFRDESGDMRKAQKSGVDLLFIPAEGALYPDGFQTLVTVENLSKNLCGPFRPGHFSGVATVVLKLLHLVEPERAYFGMKDFQQCRMIQQMVRDLNLSVRILPCPTVREEDGLACSSRNRRLSFEERRRAARIFSALQSAADLIRFKTGISKESLFRHFKHRLELGKSDRMDYLEIVDPQTLTPLREMRPPLLLATAVWIGKTRLIDNCWIKA